MSKSILEFLGKDPFDKKGGSGEPTLERIADAVELLAAIAGHEFFNAKDYGHQARNRFANLVEQKATKFAKRHGA